MRIDQRKVGAVIVSRAVLAEKNTVKRRRIARLWTFEKVLRPYIWGKKNIVVKIYELLGKAFYSVKIQFDSVWTKGRKIFFGDKIFMIYDIKLFVSCIEPRRQMPPGNKMNFIYPGCKFFYGTKPISQVIPVAKTDLAVSGGVRFFVVFRLFLLPVGVASVNPSNNKVDRLFNKRSAPFIF